MADTNQKIEREYVVPLRREWLKVPQYRRAGRAAKALKRFIAKHMKVEDRDVDKVKVDMYINNEIWYRGRASPPSKIKVRAIKENGIVRVEFVDVPKHVKFLKAKHDRRHKKTDKRVVQEKKPEIKAEEKTEEEKKDETEKEKSVEQQNIKQAEASQKEQKHLTKVKEPKINRMALKK